MQIHLLADKNRSKRGNLPRYGRLETFMYRDENGKAIDIYPNPNKYGTNWITFYK